MCVSGAEAQYAIAGLFVGWGGQYGCGLVGILIFVVAVLLLFKNTHWGDVFDLVMGANRWAIRVGAFVALMTPEYPPFRLDPGPYKPAGPASGGRARLAGEPR